MTLLFREAFMVMITYTLVWVVVGVGVVLCENCIVDASIFIFCLFYCVSER